ncbi:GNAT family N-acetyltransferase [Rhodobacteraceae bacterium 2376]|uniref:GNAT family N-acetyltransferase n=1 Tax=Rhabdonatronobacter sediminivivens TaxID=2743469 RepID=A0A7Z0I1J5_9RHOB|nr:GNAT family N-acetyltransferase [Rhabdonatronobacter sediminivivens]NYS26140.1 GNAT family N-acetyltransferase [Rhabdonatronobacter sediminivivens]
MSATALPIPVLETGRLILRGPEERDFEAFASFGASERARWVGGPYPRFRSWGAFLGAFGHWALRGFGMWMLECRITGTTAGRIGMIAHDGWAEPELGWHIYEGFEGRGLAFEGAQAARDFAGRHQGLDRVISYIDPANTRSARLAERLGARPESDGTLLGQPVTIWRHPSVKAT